MLYFGGVLEERFMMYGRVNFTCDLFALICVGYEQLDR